jgi:hypothetical protein
MRRREIFRRIKQGTHGIRFVFTRIFAKYAGKIRRYACEGLSEVSFTLSEASAKRYKVLLA